MYVFALVGESPAVLTELLWWLRFVEDRWIAGVEVWTTRGGEERLRSLAEGDRWADLSRSCGVPDLLPRGSEMDSSAGFWIRTFGADAPLEDVQTPEEAAVVNAELHDALRDARRRVADRVPILGSLAGGRKTASAALQTAFCLQAMPGDRLVHVVLSPRFEAVLRKEKALGEFLVPNADWAQRTGVPEAEQVIVYDVPFPRVREILTSEVNLIPLLDSQPWMDLWPAFEANTGRSVRAVLQRCGDLYEFRLEDPASGERLHTLPLPARLGVVFAGAVEAGGTSKSVVEWMLEHDVGYALAGDGYEEQGSNMRTAMSELRTALVDLPPGFEHYVPSRRTYVVAGHIEVFLEP